PTSTSPLEMSAVGKRKVLDATLFGSHKESDIALLKVEAHGLPVLPLAATRPAHPGELVIAIGSPDGLQGSVTMGIVSSVWRQPNPNVPMVYIQTDAPINPGNSGGPLIDLDGYVIGLNTFIFSKGGGSEGLGFAVPARIVRFVYDNLRKYGFVQRAEIGVSAQEITPTLAAGLGLSRDWGVVIADVTPLGPAAAAGLRSQDIIDAVDDRQVVGLPGLAAALYLHPADEDLKLEVLRDRQKISVVVPAVQRKDERYDLADFRVAAAARALTSQVRRGYIGVHLLRDQKRSFLSSREIRPLRRAPALSVSGPDSEEERRILVVKSGLHPTVATRDAATGSS